MWLSQKEGLMGGAPAVLGKSVEEIDLKRVEKHSWRKKRQVRAKERGAKRKQTPSPL
jgi:hypothetical protein